MPDTFLPLDILAEELGAIAARIERETLLRVAALEAKVATEIEALRARAAEADLRAEIAERERDVMVEERLATVRDGPPGERGERGEKGDPGESIIGPPGADSTVPGPPGPEPYVGEVCGLFDPDRVYRKYDLVRMDGAEWRAKCDAPGKLPGDGWALAAKAGERGKRGDIGPRGERGLSAATIVEWAVRDYRAVPVMSDGSVGPPLDLRSFFEQYHAEAAE